jgi:hypothetical protein
VSDKPSYLGLLNAIALGESEAECYLNAWASTTADEGVRQVISTVALREGEHGKAFAKRLCELGFSVLPRPKSDSVDRMAIASSRQLSDKEKFERLGLAPRASQSGDDVFSHMFDDTTIDIQTGALLGRYIAEERDSGRMLRSCYAQLCARENGDGGGGGRADGELSAQLSRIERLLEQLLAAQARVGDTNSTSKPSRSSR